MRRSAWKQWRSWPLDSEAMWADSEASHSAGRVHRLALAPEHRGDRVLREPVDLRRSGRQPRSSSAMARSRRA